MRGAQPRQHKKGVTEMNNKLINVFKLSHKVTVYVPTQNKRHEVLDAKLVEEMEIKVAKTLTEVNGGATATDGIGYWHLPDGTTCRETVRLIMSYTENVEAAVDAGVELATWIKDVAQQDAVSLEVDGEIYFI
jgi:hypothetical protein